MSLASSRAEEGCQISVPEILDSVQNRSCIILNLFFFFFCSHNRCSKNCLVLHLMQLIKTPSGDESSAGPAIQLQEAKYIQRLKTQKAIIYRGQLDIENTTGHKILVVHCSFPYLETRKKKKKKRIVSVWLPFFTHKSQGSSQTSSPLPFFVCWGKKVSGLPERDMPHRDMPHRDM